MINRMIQSHNAIDSDRAKDPLRKLVVLTFLVILLCRPGGPVSAQSDTPSIPIPPVNPRFSHLTTEDGLAHNHVSAIIQDRFGFMWFGTLNGLNRYDGYSFIRFRHDPYDPNSLSSNNISAVLEGPNGYIWVATEDGGLNRVDPSLSPDSGLVIRYQHDEADDSSLSDDYLESLAFDQDGILWIGTGRGGLDRFDPAAETFTHYLPPSPFPEPTAVEAVLVDSDGQLWVGGEVLFHFDPETGQFTPFPISGPPPPQQNQQDGQPVVPPPPPIGVFPNYHVNAIYKDENGRLWIGSNVLYLFDPETGEFTPYAFNTPSPVQAVISDANGLLWIATTNGAYYFNPETEQFGPRYIDSQSDPSNSFLGRLATFLYRSPEGLIWIATTSGLNIYNWQQPVFTTYT
ncbi:MAG: two-component regulator propeller domain-containing protein, partial [Candidatus Promineifilaceae bacterium]